MREQIIASSGADEPARILEALKPRETPARCLETMYVYLDQILHDEAIVNSCVSWVGCQ